ncbi:MAG: hypothetical protein GY714_14080 [Desulfobacterales bacterium]|nr:hypothetical protein [Desulfobacterales bacterium]
MKAKATDVEEETRRLYNYYSCFFRYLLETEESSICFFCFGKMETFDKKRDIQLSIDHQLDIFSPINECLQSKQKLINISFQPKRIGVISHSHKGKKQGSEPGWIHQVIFIFVFVLFNLIIKRI